MATRPSWTGNIRISLVSFPVQIFAGALSPRRIAFHQIYEPTGERVRNQPVTDSGKKVEKDKIVKGYEYEKNKYVTLTPDEIKEVKIPTKDTVEICEFVDVAEIDLIYFDTPYYVVPHDSGKNSSGTEAFNVFREALHKSGKAALGEVVMAGKEHLVALRPYGRGMLLETLRYADEVKEADKFFDEIKDTKIDKESLALANSLIQKKNGSFKVDKYEDSYESALQKLVERKLKNLPLHEPEPDEDSGSSNVISLMDALKRSVEGKAVAKPTAVKVKTAKSKPAAKKPSAKKPAKKTAKKVIKPAPKTQHAA